MTTHADPRGAVVGGGPAGAPPAIATLTGIRAIAAAWVVLHHFRGFVLELLPGLRPFLAGVAGSGYLGVDVFFVLSGFILAYNYAERIDFGPAYRKYLWARFARVYPAHLVTLLLVLGCVCTFFQDPSVQVTRDNVVANVFLVQPFLGLFGINLPSWSIGCEAVAYLVFPVLAWGALRLSARATLICAISILLGGVVAICLSVHEPPPNVADFYVVCWLRIATEFTAGVLLWRWWRAARRASWRWDLVAIASLVATIAWCSSVPEKSAPTYLAVPLIALFVISCASATGPLARLLCSRVMQWGGRVSYSLYLTHSAVLLVLNHVLPSADYVDADLPVRLVVVLLLLPWTLIPAAFIHHFVEEPARMYLLSRRARRRPEVPVGSPG